MEPYVSQSRINPEAARIIRSQAYRLVGRAGFTRSDVPDIEQELLQAAAVGQASYDPSRAEPATFLRTLIKSKSATLVRNGLRSKRRAAVLHSLAESRHNGATALEATVSDSRLRAHRGVGERSIADLRADLQVLLNRLSEPEADLCRRLMRTSLSEVARELKAPRSTLQDAVRRLRGRFEDEGLAIYCNPPVKSSADGERNK